MRKKQYRVVDLLIDRLAERASGARPATRGCGIAYDLGAKVLWQRGLYISPLLGAFFDDFGLVRYQDLMKFRALYLQGDWKRSRAYERKLRVVSYQLMVELIASAGYQGKYV